MTTAFPLTFRLSRNWIYLITTTLACILVFQFMSIRGPAGRSEFAPLLRGEVATYLTKLAYYFPLELITAGLILVMLRLHRRWFGLYSVMPSAAALLTYQLVYLPAILIGIGIACPVTNTLRYLMLYAGEYGWEYYFPQYCFTWRMYLKYLLPVLLFSYGFLNANLLLDYMDWQRRTLPDLSAAGQTHASPAEPAGHGADTDGAAGEATQVTGPVTTLAGLAYLTHIDAFDQRGQTLLPLSQVYYFEVQGKTYLAHSADKTYTVHRTLTQLTLELDPRQFLRISRGIIVNVRYVDNYSHWKYDKFIVRLKDRPDEFVMQRSHLRALKTLLASRP